MILKWISCARWLINAMGPPEARPVSGCGALGKSVAEERVHLASGLGRELRRARRQHALRRLDEADLLEQAAEHRVERLNRPLRAEPHQPQRAAAVEDRAHDDPPGPHAGVDRTVRALAH